MTNKEVLQHLLRKLEKLRNNIELNINLNDPNAKLNVSAVRLQSYLNTVKLLTESEEIIKAEIAKESDEQDEPDNQDELDKQVDEKEYLENLQRLDILQEVGYIGGDEIKKEKSRKRGKLGDTALEIKNLLDAINQDKTNVSVGEEGLTVLLNDVYENGLRGAYLSGRDLDDTNYKDANALIGKEPDLLTDNLSPLPIDPAKVSEFKPELDLNNKEAFDESFRQFLWLAMTDSKVSLFIENNPELRDNDAEKQRILNDWQQRPARKALNDAIAWISKNATPQVKHEYFKRLNEIAENTVKENRGNEFFDLDKSAIKVASVRNMISSLSKTHTFGKLVVSEDLQEMYKTASDRIADADGADYDHDRKLQDISHVDPEFSTYIESAERYKLKDLYTKLVNLEVEDSSASYKDMVQAVRKVLTTPYSSFAHGNEQLTKDLGMCELTCHKYLDTHKSYPITQAGRDRVALAKDLRDFSQDFCQKSWPKITKQVLDNREKITEISDDDISHVKRNWMDEKEFDKLMASSKLCSAVQPMRFRPSMHKKVPTFSLAVKFNTLISKIASIIPILLTPSAWFTTHSAWKAMKLTNEEVKEKVVEALPAAASPQNVDKETVGEDGIILDKRRIPLVWAKEIPEDPDQGIELTINVKQAVDGEDWAVGASKNGGTEANSTGEKGWDAGHGFFTLKYTSTDPATGQKRRYQTTFGFGGGEYDDPAAMANWYFTDAMIKGSIHNDENERASIGQSFKITPEQFNKLITFTEGYAKGGYNLMKRNCCTFLADACKDIGLKEADDLFVEGDANMPAGLKIAVGVGTLLTPLASTCIAQPISQLFTTSRAAKVVGTPSYDYQTFGESLVTPEDIKQMQSYKGIASLHGYNPGSIAERMRSKYGKNFRSNRWSPKLTEEESELETGEIKVQAEKLKEAIGQRMTPIISKMKPVEREAELLRLQAIYDAIDQNYNKLGKAIEAGTEYLRTNHNDPETIRRAATQLTNATRLYRENILSIYHNGLKSDDKLNVTFAHFISTIERCEINTQEYFRKAMKTAARSINLIHKDVSKFVDTKREAVASLACVVGGTSCGRVGRSVPQPDGTNTFIGSDGTPFDLLSIYDVCETMEEYINASDDKRDLVNQFKSVNALKADINTPFTEREIRMMFNQIPRDEDDFPNASEVGFPHMKGSDALKGFLYEKLFSGFGPEIRKEADKFVALDAVITIPENDNDPVALLEKQRLKSLYANMMEKGIDFIDRKLANDPKAREAFEIMVDATMDYHGYQKNVTDDITEEMVAANKAGAAQKVKLDIVKNLFVPQFLHQTSIAFNDYKIIKNIHTLRGKEGNIRNPQALSGLPNEYFTEFENLQTQAIAKANMGIKLTKENIYPDYIEPNYDDRITILKTEAKERQVKEAEAKKAKEENAKVDDNKQLGNV